MFGGGLDLLMCGDLLLDQAQIPHCLCAEDFKLKIMPNLTARVVLVVEKDTVFSYLTQTQYMIERRQEILLITVITKYSIKILYRGKAILIIQPKDLFACFHNTLYCL